ncbi:helix-turn-helix transcriptional regulator [uncultured Anoxybacillus sp.]|uniref:helix-turn-helix domain-containing protein n=1 Tax=uncultured Anoxybacillus sp. TaxID=263860 RepID=UPI0026022DDE|nr:helix-turn-helix transcriptional regulator [uncultured Anoxybacillus sp.]
MILVKKLNKLLEEKKIDVQALSTSTGLSVNKLQEFITGKEIHPPARVLVQIANVLGEDPLEFLRLSKEEYPNTGISMRIVARQDNSLDVALEFCIYESTSTGKHYKFQFVVNKEKFLDFTRHIEEAIMLWKKKEEKITHENEPLVRMVDSTKIFIDEQKMIEIHIIADHLLIDFRTFFIQFPLSLEQKEMLKLHSAKENVHVNLHISANFMRKYKSLAEHFIMAGFRELVFRETFIIQQIQNVYTYPVSVS